jgi:hypothetical protein
MSDTATIVTVYDRRVALVAQALTTNSKVKGDAATALAVHVLHALDHIPENVR